MKVAKTMTRGVRTCRPTDPVRHAAELMWEQDCGCVPVVTEAGELVGMITDRDACMAACATGGSLDAIPVQEVMSSSHLTVCRPDDDVEEALEAMAKGRFRRLPVVEKDGTLAGLLSLADVVHAARDKDARARRKWAEGVFETLAAVTKPRRARRQRVAKRIPVTVQA